MFFLLIAFVVGICLEIGLLYFSTDLWSAPHRLCLSLIPSSPMNPHLAAMICGAPLPPPAAKVWILSSLIHVFVVSGAHLVLIATVLQKLRMPWGLCTLLLGIYTALCHFQPPVVRAFVHWLLSSSLEQMAPHRSRYRVALAGMCCLLLWPAWLHSLSLQLSWTAALALSSKRSDSFLSSVHQQMVIYLCVSTLLVGLGNLHPIGIVVNLLLAPLVASVGLFLSFVALTLRWPEPFEIFILLLQEILTPLSELIPPPPSSLQYPRMLGWFWLLGLHLTFSLLERKRNAQ